MHLASNIFLGWVIIGTLMKNKGIQPLQKKKGYEDEAWGNNSKASDTIQ